MAKITIVDIQHKEFKKTLQGYDRNEVNEFLDEIIETLEDEAQARAALQGEMADLRERISHFKAMEESLQSTLLLAQRTADEVKAAAHKEADLIKQEARIAAEREIAALADRIYEAQREAQRHQDTAEKAKSELRSLLMSHLAILERTPLLPDAVAAQAVVPATSTPLEAPVAASGDTDAIEQLPLNNGSPTHQMVE
ncbi:MAG TPA: DivIVA domain-containing protein [Candidatus Elarobacter sp.]|jgi:cell division initiation protein|nr:DivIVA domain-containing protein [Candidatus Elarobacter sp.]